MFVHHSQLMVNDDVVHDEVRLPTRNKFEQICLWKTPFTQWNLTYFVMLIMSTVNHPLWAYETPSASPNRLVLCFYIQQHFIHNPNINFPGNNSSREVLRHAGGDSRWIIESDGCQRPRLSREGRVLSVWRPLQAYAIQQFSLRPSKQVSCDK